LHEEIVDEAVVADGVVVKSRNLRRMRLVEWRLALVETMPIDGPGGQVVNVSASCELSLSDKAERNRLLSMRNGP